MNREIKFRAWDTKNKKWLKSVPYLEYLLDDEDAEISHHDIDEEMGMYFYPHNPLGPTFCGRVIYQQFTNLKDKNGTEIYEGDILKFPADWFYLQPIIGEVIYDVSCYYFISNNNYCNAQIKWRIEGDGYLKSEIIGNIFENRELLENR
jgi:uncharacterized phage protein (TIGR01671 family)